MVTLSLQSGHSISPLEFQQTPVHFQEHFPHSQVHNFLHYRKNFGGSLILADEQKSFFFGNLMRWMGRKLKFILAKKNFFGKNLSKNCTNTVLKPI